VSVSASRTIPLMFAMACVVSLSACGDDQTGPSSQSAVPMPGTDAETSSPGRDSLVESPGPIGWMAARSGDDGDTLTIFFTGGAEYVAGDPCTIAFEATAAETADSVAVKIVGRSPSPKSSSMGCDDLGYARQISVELGAPLAGRSVVESVSGTLQAVFDGSTLVEPGWLPDGWVLRGEGVAFPTADPSKVWSRSWGAPTDEGADSSCIVNLIEGDPTVVSTIAAEMGGEIRPETLDIQGLPAEHRTVPERDSERLTWTHAGIGYSISGSGCSGGDEGVELLAQIANSLQGR